MGPYKPVRNWVDDHPLLYGNNGSLDPSTINHKQSSIHTVNIPLSHGSYRSKHHFSIYNPPVFKTNGSTPKKLGVFVFLDVFSFFQGTKNIQIPCFPSFFFFGVCHLQWSLFSSTLWGRSWWKTSCDSCGLPPIGTAIFCDMVFLLFTTNFERRFCSLTSCHFWRWAANPCFFLEKSTTFTPQKSNIDTKYAHFLRELPFPRPIILGIQPLDFKSVLHFGPQISEPTIKNSFKEVQKQRMELCKMCRETICCSIF